MWLKNIKSLLTALSLMSGSVVAGAELPKATMDDYVWEILPDAEQWWGDECEYNDAIVYQQCMEQALENHDNQLIKKWQIADKVMREKDTLYVKVPNRQHPLTFRDYQNSKYEDAGFSYDLSKYDPAKKLLFINKQLWETTDSVLVDMQTGFSYEFEGSNLDLSPNKQYAITVETYPSAEAIMLWERAQDGRYEQVAVSETFYQEFEDHLGFYNGNDDDRANVMVAAVKTNWLSNNQLLVDFYFKINYQDTAAYRVRFNVVKAKPAAPWQINAVK